MRSIRILAVMAVAAATCMSGHAEGKWTELFDGKSTAAWRGYKMEGFPADAWKVEDGVLKAVAGGHGDLVTKEVYRDFELELEWKVTPGANSGIMYRATEDNEYVWQSGPEMQVLDDAKHADGKNPLTSAGALYALIAPTDKKLEPVGEWNKVRIVAKDKHVEHWLNGKKVVEYEWGSDGLAKLIAGSKFAAFPNFAKAPEGHIALQNHGDEVWFRNVRIRRL